jgi:hypothetical protein
MLLDVAIASPLRAHRGFRPASIAIIPHVATGLKPANGPLDELERGERKVTDDQSAVCIDRRGLQRAPRRDKTSATPRQSGIKFRAALALLQHSWRDLSGIASSNAVVACNS